MFTNIKTCLKDFFKNIFIFEKIVKIEEKEKTEHLLHLFRD